MDTLKCGDCGASIRGVTGLQELMKLRAHMSRKHHVNVDMNEALIIRVHYEKGEKYLDDQNAKTTFYIEKLERFVQEKLSAASPEGKALVRKHLEERRSKIAPMDYLRLDTLLKTVGV